MIYLLSFLSIFVTQAFAQATSSAIAVPILLSPTETIVATASSMPEAVATTTATPVLSITETPVTSTTPTTVKAPLALVTSLPTPTPTSVPVAQATRNVLKGVTNFFAPFNFPAPFSHQGNYYMSNKLSPQNTVILLLISLLCFISGLILIFWEMLHALFLHLGIAKKNEVLYALDETHE